jgi:hypothetical protein
MIRYQKQISIKACEVLEFEENMHGKYVYRKLEHGFQLLLCNSSGPTHFPELSFVVQRLSLKRDLPLSS